MKRLGVAAGVLLTFLSAAAPALGDEFLPHPASASWTYTWSDSVYSPQGTQEQYTVCAPKTVTSPCPSTARSAGGSTFVLGWQAVNVSPYVEVDDVGNISFQDTSSGLLNTNWESTPPPAQFPILCSTSSNCANSLSGAMYAVIWGARAPVLSEPLYAGLTWSSTGGAANDVVSSSQMIGQARVSVPAFAKPVRADVVRSEITQAGALGDPYGSGVRTTWWVRGVGPVKVIMEHSGGQGAPVTTVTLDKTNQKPLAPPPDADYFPLNQGQKLTYRWTNSRYLRQPEVEKITDTVEQNRSARFTIASVSGPLKVAGDFGMTARLTGISPLFSSASASTLVKFPTLGKGRRFLSPFDLMSYGFGQVLPAYPAVGDTWKAEPGNQAYSIYGVTGTSRVVAIHKLTVPAGTYTAVEVKSVLTQPGHPFGSGTRYMWFAPRVGLVKLVFDHGDHSVSTVELIK